MKRDPYPTDLPSDSLEYDGPDRPMEGDDVQFYPLREIAVDLFIAVAAIVSAGLCAWAAAPYLPAILRAIGLLQ